MGSIHTLLPRLTMNRQFVEDFLSADLPCFEMGVLEERKLLCGFLALRTAETIPPTYPAVDSTSAILCLAPQNSKLFILHLNSIYFKHLTPSKSVYIPCSNRAEHDD